MPTPVGFDPGTFNQSTSGGFTLGAVYEYNGRLFQFVKTVDAVSVANGMVLEWASTTTYNVTPDRSGGSSLGRIPAGVAVGTITAGNYGFILIRGLHTAVKDAANSGTPVGAKMAPYASVDGDAVKASAYTDHIFAVVLVVGSGGTFTGMVSV